ncbi:Filamin-C [Toxocara canis]|uniref:Filamin-C n=1 Tax=Toxocara canis TaxID=6265 RepID=A0A0B2VVL4_TOXCA|nr:Filamin-C [Toxocara canis]
MARDEMSEKMVELSTQPDAEWKKIQQNTFTRWVNQQLKTVNVAISDLETGFEDGLKLIRLVEVLSGRHLGKFSKKVSFRSQKLENISLVLYFLENDEHVKIVNIDSSAIVDRNLKLILGLVWTLIVHYSISKQVWILPECEENVVEEVSPREKLMVWIRGKLPGELALSNFMSDWNSGVLLAALVSSCAPDLGIDWRNWDIASPLRGTRMVMKLAEKHLGVAQFATTVSCSEGWWNKQGRNFHLVTAEELLSTAVDERSVMTYLAQFPQAQYKPPLGRIEGVDPNPLVGRVSQFKVYTLRESVVVDVLLRGPDRKPLDAAIIKLTPLQYSVSYSPPTVGLYEICVSVRDPEVGDFAELELETALANLEQRFSYERVAYIGRAVVFQLDNAEEGCVEMLVEDSDGNTNLLVLTQQNTSSCYAEFTPQSDGPHLVHVSCYNKPIQGSPFELDVRHQAELVRVWGSGIAERGVRVGEVVTIFMKTDDQCTLPFLVRITGPDGEVSVTESIDEEANVRTYTYVPRTVGDYEIEMKCGDVDIQRTRTVVHVEESCLSDIRAFGCGLLGGVQGMRCVFFLQYGLTDADKLKYAVKDQRGNELKVDGVQFENGSAVLHSLHFTPDHPGVYELSVLLSGKHIMDSPFYLLVDSGDGSLNPSNACVHGLDHNQYVSVGEEASFEVDVTAVGGNIVPSVQILDDDFIDVPFHVKERRQNVFEFTFTPQSAGRHFVVISVAGMALSDSPFVVSVESEAMRAVRVDGWDAGVRSVIRAEQPIDWAITAEWIGKNTVEAVLVDARGIANPLPAQKTANNELLIHSVAPQPGIYALKLIVNGKEAASREVVVEPQVDVSQIKVGFLEGENVDMVLNQQCSIRVDTAGMLALERGLEVVVEDPDGERNILELASLNGVYTGDWKASKVGETKIMVLFDGVIVKEMRAVIRDSESGSDYQDEAGRPWSDSGDCKENTAVDIKAALERSREMDEAESEKVVSPAPFEETRHFYFDVEETFQFNNMAAVVKTPSGENRAAIIQELGRGRAEVVYKPTEAGHHVLIIKHDNTDVEGSPIEFDVVGEEERSNAVAVKGAGLLRAIAGLPTGFVICTAGPLDDELSVLVDGAAKAKVDISKDQTGAFAVKLIPPIAGEYKVHLKVGSEDLDGSPLFVVAEDDRHKRSGDSAVSFVEVSLEVGAVRELCVMTATVKGPSSTEEPCMVRPVDATHIGVNFTPNEVGDYVIVVSKNGSVVHDLPSLVHVDDKGFASLVLKGRGDQQEVVGKSVELDEVRPEEMITRMAASSLMETCCFKVIAHETFDLEKLSAFVKTPSGDRRPAHIQVAR